MSIPFSHLSRVTTTGKLFILVAVFVAFGWASSAEAATLSLVPGTGVYSTGQTFTVSILVNTAGVAINAAEGSLSFKPNEIQVVSLSKGSIFNLWTAEPSFSNSAGTITFSGGSPTGYKGSAGSILAVTFRAKAAGSPRVNFSTGSVLANDGKGTNVLTGMNGGSFTISAAAENPEPETIIEYVPPANTPPAPKVTSETHPDPTKWYANTTAILKWQLPEGVTALRTLLNENPTSIPTKVYDSPPTSLTLDDLESGVHYLHLQFKNKDGWGKIAHYRLAIDTDKPEAFALSLPAGADLSNPNQTLLATVKDATSPVNLYMIQLDGAEPFQYEDKTGSSTIELTGLTPGYHTLVVEAFDAAGNSSVATFSLTILAFDKPVFTVVPTQINTGVIPVFKGQTRPRSRVEVRVGQPGSKPVTTEVTSDETGIFTFIPAGQLSEGVYELSAVAIDEQGARSEVSDTHRFVVQPAGYLRVGAFLVSLLSVVIPLLALVVLLGLGCLYIYRRARALRRGVGRETREALAKLRSEFATLYQVLDKQERELKKSRKTEKLTKAEEALIESLRRTLQTSENAVSKEITDVDKLLS